MPNLDHPSEEDLAAFVDGLCPALVARAIEAHLERCNQCAAEISLARDVRRQADGGLLPTAVPVTISSAPWLKPGEVSKFVLLVNKMKRATAGFGKIGLAGASQAGFGGVCVLAGTTLRSPSRKSAFSADTDQSARLTHAFQACICGDQVEVRLPENASGSVHLRVGDRHITASVDTHGVLHIPMESVLPAEDGHERFDDVHPSTGWSDHSVTHAKGDAMTEFHQPSPMVGTPSDDAGLFPGHQMHNDTCAIRCQEFILEEFTGKDFGENALMDEAREHGWYHDGDGTPFKDLGKLLELHGIAVNKFEHANIFNLTQELAQGHKVMIGVDSEELWRGNPILDELIDKLGLGHADHAVVVTGIDTSDPAHVQVIVADPGTGEPAARHPLEYFLHAWAASDFTMVSTVNAAPADARGMEHFPHVGHLAEVCGMPYEQFEHMEFRPDDWREYIDHVHDAGHDGPHPIDTLAGPHASVDPLTGHIDHTWEHRGDDLAPDNAHPHGESSNDHDGSHTDGHPHPDFGAWDDHHVI